MGSGQERTAARGETFDLVELPPLARYSVAVAVAVLAVLLRSALDPLWHSKLPFIFFYPAIMVSAWLGGLGPGIVTTGVTAIAAAYFWTSPVRDWSIGDPADALGLAIFVAVGALISALNEARRRGATRLAASEQRLLVTLRSIGDAVITTDRAGRVRNMNRLAETLTGWRETEAVGRPLDEVFVVVDEATRQTVESPFGRALREGPSSDVTLRMLLVAKDGREIAIGHSAAPIVTPKGAIGLVLVFRDLSLTRAEERELERQREYEREARLGAEASARQLQLAVEASPAAMIIADERGRISFVNELGEQLFGYARSELVGEPVEVLVPSRVRPQHEGFRRGFHADLSRRPMVAGRDLYAVRKDGTELPVEIGLSPFTTPDGVFVLAAVTDITERKRIERQRAELLAGEQELVRRKDEFLATLSHELRNPLAPIRTAVHYLGARIASGTSAADAESHSMVELIERQLAHLVRLVDDLLDLSRIGRDRIDLHPQRLQLAAVVEAALESSRPTIDARDQELEVALPGEPRWVDADLVRLAQVFTNLLDNASKYTPQGGRIAILVEGAGDHATVRVRDNGEGMDEETLTRIFEMFYQGEPASGRPRTGLGIGLALAKRLVELHGGTLKAHSAGAGQGSEITVSIPLVAPPTEVIAAATRVAVAPPKRILVADDNPDAASTLGMLLELEGHAVRTAGDGLEAVEVAVDFRPEVALLDIAMPGIDGYETARRIRALPGGERIVLIALTGLGQPDDRRRSEEAGFSIHLTKPVDPAKLRALLSSADPTKLASHAGG